MTIGRGLTARLRYHRTVRKAKKEMVLYSQCDDGRLVGLLRGYQASDFEYLRSLRKRNVYTRSDKLKRKADFYMVLARMADRRDRIEMGF